MTEIPENEVTLADIAQWYKLQAELAKLKSAEGLLRNKLFKHFFPNPKEGTNNFELKDGTGAVLKAKHNINRKVDEGEYQALRVAQNEAYATAEADQFAQGVDGRPNIPRLPLDDLVKWKPEVSISEYRKLTEEERQYFDQCLVITPGSPQLEIAIPKRAK